MNYEIKGQPFPVVEINLEQGEKVCCEGGAMVWMSDNMEMETKAGGFNKILGKMFSGEKIFQNIYTAKNGKGMLTIGTEFMGNILAIEIVPGKPVICQKSAFLGSIGDVDLSVAFQKKLGAGFFGGEGFIMQKLEGSGIAFVEIDGSEFDFELAAGQKMIVSTGALAMCDSSVQMDIQSVKGVKNALFGGEGLFNTVLTGPGKIVLQSQNLCDFGSTISPYISVASGN